MKFSEAVQLNKNGTLKKEIGTNNWEVQSSFIWLINYNQKDGDKIIISKGFKTNFGSIPRLFWVFLNPTKYVSYILHDWLLWEKVDWEIQVITEWKKIYSFWSWQNPIYLTLSRRVFYV